MLPLKTRRAEDLVHVRSVEVAECTKVQDRDCTKYPVFVIDGLFLLLRIALLWVIFFESSAKRCWQRRGSRPMITLSAMQLEMAIFGSDVHRAYLRLLRQKESLFGTVIKGFYSSPTLVATCRSRGRCIPPF
ncbi:hypothetical protein TNCV_947621 [Trichonephila clavipes]|nr:hypothetical protein TNCV_947621 [Trichonephila clavipes]